MGSITFQTILCLIVFLVPWVTVCWKKSVSNPQRTETQAPPGVRRPGTRRIWWRDAGWMHQSVDNVLDGLGKRDNSSKEWTGRRRFIAVPLPWSFLHDPQCIQHHVPPHCCTRSECSARVNTDLMRFHHSTRIPLGHWNTFPAADSSHTAQSLPGCFLLLGCRVVKSLSRKQTYPRFRHFHPRAAPGRCGHWQDIWGNQEK